MRTLANCLGALLAMALLTAFSATAVSAVTSTQGADYSFEYSTTYMQTCDEESDATKVKSVADSDNAGGGTDGAKDIDGDNGTCATKNMGWTVERHRTCEYRAWWPDTCGNWQAT